MAHATHTSRSYEGELRRLREKLLLMGSLVEDMIGQSLRALATRDVALARAAMKLDRRINQMECEVDELSMRILATRQPVASDLRFITTALKIVTDLERIGDLCVNICERVIELDDAYAIPFARELSVLGDASSVVLHDALDAFVGRDAARARELLSRDDGIDAQYADIFRAVLEQMAREPDSIFRATRAQSVAKYLERISDHAMNIAEDVVFLVEGTDIRHRNRRADERPSEPPPARR